MRVPVALSAAALLAAGCAGRESSVLVTVRSNLLPDGVFDRLSIEVRRAGEESPCDGCVREFPAGGLTRSGSATFAVASFDRPVVARVSLSRARGKGARRSSTVAAVVTLAPGEGGVELRLPWDAVGQELGSWAQPMEPSSLPPLPPDPAAGQPCERAPEGDEVCVPGGLFWLGDPSIDLLGGVDREGTDERLVQLSPFLIDLAEVTVGQLRASGVASSFLPVRRELNQACTYTDDPGPFEALPVTCAPWPVADQYCRVRGRRLPTEAELEFLMGGMQSRRFVWGDDPPACDDLVFGEEDCGRAGPEPAGQGRRDRLALGGRAVVDLTGNVLEWAADRWNSTREGCFAPALLRDPRCEQPSPSQPGRRVVRGGGWIVDRSYLGAPLRLGLDGELAYSEGLGWRCARAGAP